ncbi:YPDG domain-containing protein, partial [Corynebacterium frankenforstense]|uniref:YPDG domain-containing protein n=1 Tax=Corynebacterium frankenforstense TaxID=1230998 RepID=UPI00255184A1
MNSSQIIFRRGGGSRRNAVEGLSLKRRIRILVAAGAASALAVTGSVVVPQGTGIVPAAVAQESDASNENADASDDNNPAESHDGAAVARGEMAPTAVSPKGLTKKFPKATNWNGSPAAYLPDATDPIDADVIADGSIKNTDNFVSGAAGQGTYSGRLFLDNGGSYDTTTNSAARLDGVTVYMQWMDQDSPASPVFKAKTHTLPGVNGGKGTFGFGHLNWVDANGVLHVFHPSSLIGDVRVKVWVAPNQAGPAGGELRTLRQSPGKSVAFRNPGRDGYFGTFVTEERSIQRGGIFAYEAPEEQNLEYLTRPRGEWKSDNAGPRPTPSNPESGGGNGRNMVSGKVWWESKEPDVNAAFPSSVNESVASGNRVVMSVLTPEGLAALRSTQSMPIAQRAQAQREILEGNKDYIAETVVAPIDGDSGRYTVRFKSIPGADSLYGFVVGPNDEILASYSPWGTPAFYDPNDGPHTSAFWQAPRNSLYNVHFAVVPNPDEAKLTIDHDTGENPAKRGEAVTPTVQSTIYPGQNYAIQWVDPTGKNIGDPCAFSAAGTIGDCAFKVPDGAKNGEIYQSRLLINGDIVDAKAFRVLVDYEPTYEDTEISAGETKEVLPAYAKDDASDEEKVRVTPGKNVAAYALPEDYKAPEGYTVSVDPKTGKVTVKAPDELGADTATDFEVPVEITYSDGAKKDVVKAKFSWVDMTTAEVNNEPVTVVEGQESAPFDTAKDVPENGRVESTGLPAGLEIEDPATGKVTGTPEKLKDWGEDEESRDVPVMVTIKDENDKVVAGPEEKIITVQRDTDKDGKPDVTDEDDDDDGYTDEQEKEKGSDPKDSNSIPATVIDPVEGVEITNGDQTVVEGNPIEDVTITPADKDAKVTVDEKDLPKGVDFDPESNKISGTPEVNDWGKDEEERDFEISVTVENPDGSKKTEKVTITVQRDTDKDGKPDVTDEDDDDDGY